jgi:hypothetical protein
VRRPGTYSVTLADGGQARAVEVLAILRDSADDRLIVHLDKVGYRTLVDQPEIKARFSVLMKELAETIAKADTPRLVMDSPVMDESISESAFMADDDDLPDLDTLSTLPPPAPAPRPTPARPMAAPAFTPTPTPNGAPNTLSAYRDNADPKITGRGLFRAPKVEFQPMPELNLAAAIEHYLQNKLQFTRAYPGRDIHVHSAPGGGVIIQVDDLYYDAVGDIEDAEIREFIALTIQEWQETQ